MSDSPPDESVIAGNPDYRGILPVTSYHRRFYCDWLEKTSLVDRFSREKLVHAFMLEDVYWALGLQPSMGESHH